MSIARGGAILLPRHIADRDRGQANWPKCIRCRRGVDAYGIANENAYSIEIWARCDGIRIDPRTGEALHWAPKIHPTMRDSITIIKGPGWSPNRYVDIVRRQAFFHPDGDRRWLQVAGSPDSVSSR